MLNYLIIFSMEVRLNAIVYRTTPLHQTAHAVNFIILYSNFKIICLFLVLDRKNQTLQFLIDIWNQISKFNGNGIQCAGLLKNVAETTTTNPVVVESTTSSPLVVEVTDESTTTSMQKSELQIQFI